MKKTICIYHRKDLDGWMSAAIVKHWHEGRDSYEDGSKDSLDYFGYHYGDPIPDLSEYDMVIMVDVSFPKKEMRKIYSRLNYNFIWLDHHVSAIKENSPVPYAGLTYTHKAACEITWEYLFPNDKMPEIVRLLGRYDCFGHKGTDEEQKVLEFQYGARSVINDYEKAYKWLIDSIGFYNYKDGVQSPEKKIWEMGGYVYQYLCVEAKQIYNNGFEIKFGVPAKLNDPNIYKEGCFICINRERFNPINFGIDYHKDGYDGAACFWYQNDMWEFSLYNDNGQVDVSKIAKRYGGGGHKGAAGFIINDLKKIWLVG